VTAAGGDNLAWLREYPSRYLIAEEALKRILAISKQPNAVEEIRTLALVAQAHIDRAQGSRPRVSNRRGWLAKISGFAFPRTFARAWGEDAKHHVCFTVEITDGGKAATGRQVEVQMPVDEAERLGQQMLRMAAYQRDQLLAQDATDHPRDNGAGQTPPTDGDQMT